MYDIHAKAIATVEAITAAESSTKAAAYLSAEFLDTPTWTMGSSDSQ